MKEAKILGAFWMAGSNPAMTAEEPLPGTVLAAQKKPRGWNENEIL
jgi:hypothetical protein